MFSQHDIKILRKMAEHVLHIDNTIRDMTKFVHSWLDNDRETMEKTLKSSETIRDRCKQRQISINGNDFPGSSLVAEI